MDIFPFCPCTKACFNELLTNSFIIKPQGTAVSIFRRTFSTLISGFIKFLSIPYELKSPDNNLWI